MEVFKINSIDYDCEFKLSNVDGQELSFTKSAIRGMTLVDSIFDPFTGGTVSIANPFNFLENEYFFRGDGLDKFYITFGLKENQPAGYLKYEHKFAVVNESDLINSEVRSENIKVLTLIDENALPFSNKIPYGKTYIGKVGQILQDIFVELIGAEKVDFGNWEIGDFQLWENYIPPATYRYVDLIHYFMRLYYAKAGELYVKGFINYDRKSKKFQLQLLTDIFSKNKKDVFEAFAIGDLTDTVDVSNPNHPPAEAPVSIYFGGVKNLGYSTPQYGYNTDFFINALVFGYDKILGVQRIKKIKFEDVREKWKRKFVDVFVALGGAVKPFFVANPTTKKKFRRYHSAYPVEDTVKMVEADIYSSLTFYNLQASFSNVGNTTRSGGKFVDIIKTRPNPDDKDWKIDQKLLGRWFVTELRHIFIGDLYSNELLCTKTYVGPNSNYTEGSE